MIANTINQFQLNPGIGLGIYIYISMCNIVDPKIDLSSNITLIIFTISNIEKGKLFINTCRLFWEDKFLLNLCK